MEGQGDSGASREEADMAAANRVHVPEDSAASKLEGSETSKEEADMAATKALDSEASKVEGSETSKEEGDMAAHLPHQQFVSLNLF